MTEDHFEEAQKAAEAHLSACEEAMFDGEVDGEVDDPSIAPFCGCQTCVVREILHAAWPRLRRAALEGYPE